MVIFGQPTWSSNEHLQISLTKFLKIQTKDKLIKTKISNSEFKRKKAPTTPRVIKYSRKKIHDDRSKK